MIKIFKEDFQLLKVIMKGLNAAIAQTLVDFTRLMEARGKTPHNPHPLLGTEILSMLK